MTLLKKLKPENLKKIKASKKEFPESYKSIMNSLKKEFVLDLTIDEAAKITLFCGGNFAGIYDIFK